MTNFYLLFYNLPINIPIKEQIALKLNEFVNYRIISSRNRNNEKYHVGFMHYEYFMYDNQF